MEKPRRFTMQQRKGAGRKRWTEERERPLNQCASITFIVPPVSVPAGNAERNTRASARSPLPAGLESPLIVTKGESRRFAEVAR